MSYGKFVREWEVPSESTPGKTYVVTLWLSDRGSFKAGAMSCSCPAWRYQHRPVSDRLCKHIKSVQEEIRERDTAHAIREIEGSEIEFQPEAQTNGRIGALIDTIMKLGK